MIARFAAFALALALASVAACSSSSPAPSGANVSLRNDVVPVFQSNCAATGACHGSPNGIEIYLAVDPSQASDARSRLLSTQPIEITTMPYVKPGDPANSFLMHKIDHDLESLESKCSSNDCGVGMPKDAPELDQATRDRIRSWIAQGALDN